MLRFQKEKKGEGKKVGEETETCVADVCREKKPNLPLHKLKIFNFGILNFFFLPRGWLLDESRESFRTCGNSDFLT